MLANLEFAMHTDSPSFVGEPQCNGVIERFVGAVEKGAGETENGRYLNF